MIMATGSMRKH